MKASKEKLLHYLKTTAASSFNAAKRLEHHDKKLTRLTAFSSAYVIILTVLPYFRKLPADVTDFYNFLTVVLSIVIVISSLLQYSSNNVANAEQLHRKGLDLNEQARLLMLEPNDVAKKTMEDFTQRYGAILQKYSINHEPIDFQQTQFERPEDNSWMTPRTKFSIWWRLVMSKATPDVFLLGITIVFLALIWRAVASQVSTLFMSS
jgi:hypothetical protein